MDDDEYIEECIDRLFKDVSSKSHNSLKHVGSLGIDVWSIKNAKEQTLLHVAAGFGRKKLVRFLIDNGSDVNARDLEGQAPLHYACNHAHDKVARLLIDSGASINLADNKGWTPLHFALARKDNAQQINLNYWEVVELLLTSGADPYKKSVSGKSCFDRVKDCEQRLCIRLIHLKKRLENCDNDEQRTNIIDRHIRIKDFFEFIRKGDEEIDIIEEIITPRLVKSHLDTYDNITPLHRAAGYGHIKVAQLLIENGADVSATDDHGQVPLHNAARYGHETMIQLLIGEGCDINTQDIDGLSPLHVAASSLSFAACLGLINLGANKGLRDVAGKLPFELAETDDVRQVLRIDEIPIEIRSAATSQSGQAIYMGLPSENSDSRIAYYPDMNDRLVDDLMLDSRSEERLFANPNHSIKKIILNNTDQRYQLVQERMLSTIRHHAGDTGGTFTSYEILTIERILHEKVWLRYRKFCELLDLEDVPRAERLLFHGSSFIDKIEKFGFDHRYAQPDGMFGAGIYFAADSSKSNQYTFGFGQGCLEHRDKSCYICERKMIYAQVALGKSFVSLQAMPRLSHPPPGYWSVSGEPGITEELQYPEYVIYDGRQAYPLYVITYKIKP